MKILFFTGVALYIGLGMEMQAAFAQETQTSQNVDTVTMLAHVIRWNGIWFSIFIIASAWVLIRYVDKLVAGLGNIFAERRLFFQKANAFFHFGIYIVTIVVVVLLSFVVSKEILAIIGGTIAIATGFALKDIFASMVAGFLILIDQPFQVGDRVNFGGQYGDIIAIGLRSVKLQTLDDSTVTIPNNLFMNQVTSCGNSGALDMQVVIDFHIGLEQDVQRAMDLIREATALSRYIYLPKPIVVLVSQVIVDNYIELQLRLKAYVLDTKYEKAFETDVTLRVLEAFAENDIRPPAILHRHLNDAGQDRSEEVKIARLNI